MPPLTVLDGYAAAAGDTRIRVWGQGALAVLDTYYATPAQVLSDTAQAIPVVGEFPYAGTVMLHGLRARAPARSPSPATGQARPPHSRPQPGYTSA